MKRGLNVLVLVFDHQKNDSLILRNDIDIQTAVKFLSVEFFMNDALQSWPAGTIRPLKNKCKNKLEFFFISSRGSQLRAVKPNSSQ